MTTKSQGDATAALQTAGFKVKAVQTPTTDQSQDGIVQSQDPAGGSQAKPGSKVTITVGQFVADTTSTDTTAGTG